MDLIFKANDKVSALEILEKVDKFYSESFTNLLWAMGWVIGIVGLLIPILIHLVQYYSLKKEVKNLQNEILIEAENKISKEVIKLKDKFKKERFKRLF
jgi:hypothetical protein